MDRNDGSFTRRRAAKLLGAAALSAVPAARVAAPATAGRSWCMRDPHVLVGPKDKDAPFDREAHIYVYAWEEMLDPALGANGPVRVSIEIPPNHKAKLLDADAGFLGYGYDVDFAINAELKDSSGAIDIVVKVMAPAHSKMEVQSELVPITSGKASTLVKGWSNRVLACKGKL